MSRMKRTDEAWDRARQAAAQLQPAAARVKPLARSTGAAARHRVARTRAWAAPRVERTGHVLEDNVAPKVSALLSSAAQRLDPDKPRRRPWRMTVGIAAAVTAAASAALAYLSRRRKPDTATPAAAASDAAPVSEMGGHKAAASADAEVNGEVRTS